jgi:hypothetical protein
VDLEHLARLAPLVTATAAALGFVLACRTLHVNRQIAQKRAAIDFFLKTEMDKGILDAYDNYVDGMKLFEERAVLATSMFARRRLTIISRLT